MNFSEMTVREYLSKERSTYELEHTREFLCDIVSRAKAGENTAFCQLLEMKDMKKFIKHTTARVQSKLNYAVSKDAIVVEIRYAIYNFMKSCYNTHNEVNEIQVLISSLAKWLPSNVAYSLYDTALPKKEEERICGKDVPFLTTDDVEFNMFLEDVLSKDEYKLFQDIYVDCKTNVQISKERNVSEGTIRYQNKKLLSKLRDELTI